MDFVGTMMCVLYIVGLEPWSEEGDFVKLGTNFVTAGIGFDGAIVELALLAYFTL